MRMVLLYPPPWKIPAPGEAPDPSFYGPPDDAASRRTSADFVTMPYGLLSLAAQGLRAGHEVKALNLSALPWRQVEELLGNLEADLYGLSCFTGNRRGVDWTSQVIRRCHPNAHITVGGPHVTALPSQTLEHWSAIDTVVVGEGEQTFLELASRLETGLSIEDLPGAAWRDALGRIQLGPPRERIRDLDSLAPVQEHFATHVLLTSRGCPGQCTFCGSKVMWGRRVALHSAQYTLSVLERLLPKLNPKVIFFKDDTFTVNRARSLAICRGIRQRGLNFLWSCDSRADALDEEVLREMRLAGCQQIALGVESGSPEILANIKKRISLDQVRQATQAAKKYGLRVRYYMMAGNRGETLQTFQQSLDFLRETQPHQAVFCLLSIYPGTEEFDILRERGRLRDEDFWQSKSQEVQVFADCSMEDAREIFRWGAARTGLQQLHEDSVEHLQAVLDRLAELPAAHLDLGAAYVRAQQLDAGQRHIERALELGYPMPVICHNYLACIAAAHSDWGAMQAHVRAALAAPWHSALLANVQTLQRWLDSGRPNKGVPVSLQVGHDLSGVVCRPQQPILPAPIRPEDLRWPQDTEPAVSCREAVGGASPRP